jgi:thiol:disulfide interchange protein
MRKIVWAFIAILSSILVSAQVLKPVKWSTQLKALENCEYEVTVKATIDAGWHLYSAFLDPNVGPVPTTIEMKTDANSSFISKLSESTPIKEVEAVWDNKEVAFFANSAWFKRKVKLKNGNASTITININWMVCNDGTCLPPDDKELTITIPADASCVGSKTSHVAPEKTTEKESQSPNKAEAEKMLTKIINETAILANSKIQIDSASRIVRTLETICQCIDKKQSSDQTQTSNSKTTNTNQGSVNKSNADSNTEEQKPQSGWGYFSGGFLAGLLALLTPCVFPMIPMTVSFFLKQSQNKDGSKNSKGKRNALLYALSIIIIYTGLGILLTGLFGGDTLYRISSDFWFNLIFFVILIVFAISFLGAFEITLPNSFVNKVDNMGDKGGLIGIFFMALALAVVSFSCTGPILGSAIGFAAKSGNTLNAFLIFFGFALGLAIPFSLFALFPSILQSLPKSGGWLNTVKVVLGFLELALAFKFASNADLVMQSHWLTREVFIAIWIAVFGALAIYLFGWFRMPHDDEKMEKLSVGRGLFAITILAFTIYMIPGMWGAPLKLLSGLIPPSTYAESPRGFNGNASGGGATESKLEAGMEVGPHGILIYKDYDQALAKAKAVNKPLMLDFTGYSCANCRLMEDNVWSDSEITRLLKEEVVLVSLYEDETTKLPESEQKTVIIDGESKKINTIGKKWIQMQYERYGLIAQPYYAILNHNGKDLVQAVGYTPKLEEYKDWINKGIAAFKAAK